MQVCIVPDLKFKKNNVVRPLFWWIYYEGLDFSFFKISVVWYNNCDLEIFFAFDKAFEKRLLVLEVFAA